MFTGFKNKEDVMEGKFVAYYAIENEYEIFPTFGEAEKWLQEFYSSDEGISEDSINGNDYIAKITHVSNFIETDNKKNYPCLMSKDYCEHDDTCDENCDGEEWPYDSKYDFIGHIEFRELKD